MDDDKEGRDAVKMYVDSWGMSAKDCVTLKHFGEHFDKLSLEKMLESELGSSIGEHFGATSISKALVQSYLYEKLATGEKLVLTPKLEHLVDGFKTWAMNTLSRV